MVIKATTTSLFTMLTTLLPWIILFKSEHLKVPHSGMVWRLEPLTSEWLLGNKERTDMYIGKL